MKMKMDIEMMTWLKIEDTHECRRYYLPVDITIKQLSSSKDAFQKEYSMWRQIADEEQIQGDIFPHRDWVNITGMLTAQAI